MDDFTDTLPRRFIGAENIPADCYLAYQYNIALLRHEFVHWHAETVHQPDTLILILSDLGNIGDEVRDWFAGLHPTEVTE